MSNQVDTKSKIIEAVKELIATKGVNNFSLRDIANYLDISTGSLYYHFKTKDEIISAIVQKHYAILERDYDILLDKHKGELTINRFLEVLFYKSTELFNHSKIHIYLINECMGNEILKKKTQELWQEWKNKLTMYSNSNYALFLFGYYFVFLFANGNPVMDNDVTFIN